MRNRFSRLLTSSLAVLALALSGCQLVPGQSAASSPGLFSDHILLGLQADLTGNALVGLGGRLGVELAVAEINKHGGVNGRRIDLVPEDSAATSDGGVLAMRKLIQDDNVFVVINSASSDATLASLNFAQTAKVPVVVTAAVDPRVLDPFRRYIFLGAGVPAGTAAKVYVNYLANTLKSKNVGMLIPDSAYAQSLKTILTDALPAGGVKIATAQSFTTNDTDFTAQVQALKQANPDVVFILGTPVTSVRIVSQVRRAGLNPTFLGDQNNGDQQLIALGGPDVEGFYTVWISGTQFINDQTGAMGQWRAAFSAQNPDPPQNTPNQFTLQSYADTYVMAEALRVAGANPTRESFVDAMENMKDFVAGKDPTFAYAEPVMVPRGFTKDSHQGNHFMLPVVVKNGKFDPAGPVISGL